MPRLPVTASVAGLLASHDAAAFALHPAGCLHAVEPATQAQVAAAPFPFCASPHF